LNSKVIINAKFSKTLHFGYVSHHKTVDCDRQFFKSWVTSETNKLQAYNLKFPRLKYVFLKLGLQIYISHELIVLHGFLAHPFLLGSFIPFYEIYILRNVIRSKNSWQATPLRGYWSLVLWGIRGFENGPNWLGMITKCTTDQIIKKKFEIFVFFRFFFKYFFKMKLKNNVCFNLTKISP
jgi:hypothetical protein